MEAYERIPSASVHKPTTSGSLRLRSRNYFTETSFALSIRCWAVKTLSGCHNDLPYWCLQGPGSPLPFRHCSKCVVISCRMKRKHLDSTRHLQLQVHFNPFLVQIVSLTITIMKIISVIIIIITIIVIIVIMLVVVGSPDLPLDDVNSLQSFVFNSLLLNSTSEELKDRRVCPRNLSACRPSSDPSRGPAHNP